jgi:hypothetical protein
MLAWEPLIRLLRPFIKTDCNFGIGCSVLTPMPKPSRPVVVGLMLVTGSSIAKALANLLS